MTLREKIAVSQARIAELVTLLDQQLGTPCEEIRHAQEMEVAQARIVELEARNGNLGKAVAYATQKFTRQEARIAELEKARDLGIIEGDVVAHMNVVSLQARVAELEAALMFYAVQVGMPNDGPWGINSTDFGAVARAALIDA